MQYPYLSLIYSKLLDRKNLCLDNIYVKFEPDFSFLKSTPEVKMKLIIFSYERKWLNLFAKEPHNVGCVGLKILFSMSFKCPYNFSYEYINITRYEIFLSYFIYRIFGILNPFKFWYLYHYVCVLHFLI